jgi:hypothetical protein
MHPEIAKILVAQRCDELVRHSVPGRRARRRWLPQWHVSWTRLSLASAPGAMSANRAGHAGRRGSSLVIIISAHRPA